MTETNPKTILISLNIGPNADWRNDLEQIKAIHETQIALSIQGSQSEERRALYRALEQLDGLSIPFVQISPEIDAWEFDYLSSTFQSSIFSLTVSNKAFSLLSGLPKYVPVISLRNSSERKYKNLFSDEALTRAGVNGATLDLALLEHDRERDEKNYNILIHALDHHSLQASVIRPQSEAMLKKFFGLQTRHLTSLRDLHYIKYVPTAYIAQTLVIDMDNSPLEQKEIKQYLAGLIK